MRAVAQVRRRGAHARLGRAFGICRLRMHSRRWPPGPDRFTGPMEMGNDPRLPPDPDHPTIPALRLG